MYIRNNARINKRCRLIYPVVIKINCTNSYNADLNATKPII